MENHGLKRILLVDDEPSVLSYLKSATRFLGFASLEASSAEDALVIFSRNPSIDAVVTDVKMGGMDGFELGRRLKAQNPGLPILYVSGHLGDLSGVPEEILGSKREALLRKPFTPVELSKVLEFFFQGESARDAAYQPA